MLFMNLQALARQRFNRAAEWTLTTLSLVEEEVAAVGMLVAEVVEQEDSFQAVDTFHPFL
jgi:hypothetical protein